MSHSYFLGIDGGGSKCKARLEDASRNLLAEYVSGPANPMRNYELAIDSIQKAIQGVFAKANVSASHMANTRAVIGLAGVNIPSCLHKMNQWKHPFASLQLTTDLHIACVGAHRQPSGAIVIIGTGSSGVVCKNMQQIEYGGHGFTLGDKGGGAWFGAQSIRYLLEALDGVAAGNDFTQALLAQVKAKSAYEVVEQYSSAAPAHLAQLAPLVFEYADKKDPVALDIVQEGALYINDLCEQLLQQNAGRLSLIGGLSNKLLGYLSPLLQARISSPLNPPEVGAILIAHAQQTQNKRTA